MTFSLPFKLDLGGNDNAKGVTLALSSGLFIGASFIIKKKGLQHRKIKHPVARTAKHGKMLHRGPWWPFRPRHKMGAKAAQKSKQQHLRRAHAH